MLQEVAAQAKVTSAADVEAFLAELMGSRGRTDCRRET